MVGFEELLSGKYMKEDGLSFILIKEEGKTFFIYRNQCTEITPTFNSGFTVNWEFGESQFLIESKTKLKENNSHVFTYSGLPDAQVRSFSNNGALLLHNVIDKTLIRNVLNCEDVKKILWEATQVDTLFYSSNSGDSSVIDLAKYIWPIIESICGESIPLPKSAQIAVKSSGGSPLPFGGVGEDFHIDGLYAPGNGVPIGTILPSTNLLLGIALTDVPHQNMGNFCFIPGSHLEMNRVVQELGPEKALEALQIQEGGIVEEAMKKVIHVKQLSPPQSVCCLSGSIYLAHYQTIHFVQPNSHGLTPRVAAYYRIQIPSFTDKEKISKLVGGFSNCRAIFDMVNKLE